MRASRLLLPIVPGFPIRHRVIDMRLSPQAEIQVNYQQRKSENRSHIETGHVRQSTAPPWSAKIRPTHFVSMRIPLACALQHSFQAMKDAAAQQREALLPLFVQPARLHLTLTMLSVPEPTSPQQPPPRASEGVVADIVRGACKGVASFKLCFRGLGTFSDGRVLFARPNAELDYQRLAEFVRHMRAALAAQTVDVKGNPHDEYVPHVTIAKVRPQHREQLGVKRVPDSLWADYKLSDFGDVRLRTVEVCSLKGQSPDGYYRVVEQFSLC